MDCRSFKKKHLAYVDDTLPGFELAAMQAHLRACSACAQQDASVRRSLLVLRNLPPIQPSAGFSDRLRDRLAVGASAASNESLVRGPSLRAFVGVASALLFVGTLSITILDETSRKPRDPYPRLPPVVVANGVTAPQVVDGELAAPAFVASMSMGMPMWPALLLAEQGSLRFASAELKPVSYRAPQR
jgi:anti-sigma factor RsiW